MRRRIRVGYLISAVVTLAVLCCVGSAVAFFLQGLSNSVNSAAFGAGCGGKTVDVKMANLPKLSRLSDTQMHNAAIVVGVGQQMKVPARGWVIAIATALQESDLINLPNLGGRNDHDSLGLFQQRASQGWGTPQQVMDPTYSSTKFYEHLLQVPNWQSRALTDVAQAVHALTGGAARAAGSSLAQQGCAQPGQIAASGWTAPVVAPIISGFRTPERPTHDGVDLGAGRGTPIRAAAGGVVTL